MRTAKVFRSGNSQAVRIPVEFQFDTDEVEIFRRDDELKIKKTDSENKLLGQRYTPDPQILYLNFYLPVWSTFIPCPLSFVLFILPFTFFLLPLSKIPSHEIKNCFCHASANHYCRFFR